MNSFIFCWFWKILYVSNFEGQLLAKVFWLAVISFSTEHIVPLPSSLQSFCWKIYWLSCWGFLICNKLFLKFFPCLYFWQLIISNLKLTGLPESTCLFLSDRLGEPLFIQIAFLPLSFSLACGTSVMQVFVYLQMSHNFLNLSSLFFIPFHFALNWMNCTVSTCL